MSRSRISFAAGLLSVIVCALSASTFAQSSDQALPTAVTSNEIDGKIDPLDLGDPRLTRHFYAFEGTPGDLLITLESRNLNGDIDVFTAVTFRPLTKATVYASVQQEITKDIYLRTRQILILRVEARTPNDDPGSYHIRFGGTFARFSGGIPVAESNTAAETETEKPGANRLSSVGATIPRPAVETNEAANTAPEKPSEEPKSTSTKPSTTSRRTTSRTPRRGSRPTTARSKPAKTSAPSIQDTAKSQPKTSEGESVPAKSTETGVAEEKPKAQETTTPQPSPHLIIEKKDGTRIDRPMATVRRVIVEGAAIVVVSKSGRIERFPMSEVARMAIEPQ